ncbi:hypothetical protein [uncultured Parabacteroides sp.]|uniref:hypothetical protein n=1 Tax=uncultured Parabacteroides sp. TaxID=512312 RepID=UPI00261F1D27|nr:hypothetical protein [uncultured Parabacteroides sp.]
MQKSLELMNIMLSTVISDITGLSGRRIISAILAGNRAPEYLTSLAMSNCKASKEEIAASLEGTWYADLLFTLKQSVEASDFFINQYRRIHAKSGALQANVATAHKIAKIFYTMVKTKKAYDSSKVGLYEEKITEKKIAKLERALAKLRNAS